MCGYKLPTFLWFQISGFICDVIQAYLDYFISIIYLFSWEKVTVCWTLSYIMSICVRHSMHRLLVFGEYDGTYWSSLSRTYLAYSTSIVLSTLCNNLLVKYGDFSHKEAWLLTMLWTGKVYKASFWVQPSSQLFYFLIAGVLNYFMLKATWRSTESKTAEGKEFTGKMEV